MKQEKQLRSLVKSELQKLLCETHPEVCKLRDENYNALEAKVLQYVTQDKEPISIQTAIARLESDLGDSLV